MIPEDITGSSTKLVYLYLKNCDEPKNTRELSDDLNMSLLCVYPVIRRMYKNGYVIEKSSGYIIEG